jgi:hypothetical protein
MREIELMVMSANAPVFPDGYLFRRLPEHRREMMKIELKV